MRPGLEGASLARLPKPGCSVALPLAPCLPCPGPAPPPHGETSQKRAEKKFRRKVGPQGKRGGSAGRRGAGRTHRATREGGKRGRGGVAGVSGVAVGLLEPVGGRGGGGQGCVSGGGGGGERACPSGCSRVESMRDTWGWGRRGAELGSQPPDNCRGGALAPGAGAGRGSEGRRGQAPPPRGQQARLSPHCAPGSPPASVSLSPW